MYLLHFIVVIYNNIAINTGRKQRRQDQPFCTDEFSDMTPLSGGNVAFSTLEGREGAYDFENSPELQEWVSATDIQIRFSRLNTFGDEVFGDEKVLRSYYYAVHDFTVGGRYLNTYLLSLFRRE